MASIFSLLVAGSYCWFVASSLWVYPHSLSYFNESIGGPLNGAEHLLGSNVDWGQDLRYLKWWNEEHPEARPVYLAYFGLYDPADVGFYRAYPVGTIQEQGELVDKVASLPNSGARLQIDPGWYAIGVTILKGYRWAARDGSGNSRRLDVELLNHFSALEPTANAGLSVYIYRVH